MSYKKFEQSDLIFNTVKVKPKFKFKIYDGKIVLVSTNEEAVFLEKINN